MWRWVLAGSFVVLVAVLAWLYWPQPGTVPGGALTTSRLQVGPYPVRRESFQAVDVTRATSANGKYLGSPERVLEGSLWRPDASAALETMKFPLVVYSHGFMSFHREGSYLAHFLASHGYVVVAVDYPLTNYFAPGGPRVGDVVNQPGDVRFVIDRMLARSGNPEDVLYRQIDEDRIAAVGLSLGGMTTELVTFDSRMRDPRIRAAISIAGPSRMFTERFFETADVPFMMIAGDADAIVPYAYNGSPIRQKDPDSVLITLKQASHAGFAGIADVLFRWANNPDFFGCASMEGKVDPNDSQFASLVDTEAGVVPSSREGFCENYQSLPRAMRPALQQSLTILAVHGFLESVFADNIGQRDAARNYLLRVYPAENSEVTADAGDYARVLQTR